jgi:hypothetical protein
MSREIKFRVWDKESGVWCGAEVFIGSGYSNIEDQTEWGIVQRFVGKKDEKGKEIYEGDVLEYSEGVELGDYTKCIGVVVYDEISCAFGIAPTADSDPINYFWEGTLKGFRVVGNIFEKAKE